MNPTAEPIVVNRIAPFDGVRLVEPDIVFPAAKTRPLAGKIALVSGGAQGIGRATAVELAQQGAGVAVNDLAAAADTETVCTVIRSFGVRTYAARTDLADELLCADMVARVLEEFGRIDVLVHGAGVHHDAPFHLLHRRQWDETVDATLGSAYNLIRALINPMRQRGQGRIVLVTDPPPRHGLNGHAHMSAAQAALVGLAKSLALENAARGITVNCVCPGLIESRQTRNMTDADRERLTGLVPMGRMGRPEEVARLIAFLASDQAAYITGQEFHIDGGLSI